MQVNELKKIPKLPLPPMETYTWAELISAGKKVPTAFGVNTLQELYDYVDTLQNNIPNTDSFNADTWFGVTEAVKKIPTTFEENTLQTMKEVVDAIPTTFNTSIWNTVCNDVDYMRNRFNYIPNDDLFNTDTWNMVYSAANMIPSSFNSNTLQQMYSNVNDLMNGGGSGSGSGSGESGSSSSTDFGKDIEALQQAVGALQSAIPSTFNSSTWTNARANITEILSRIANLPYLPNLPDETYTWVKLVNAGKKVPESFDITTLQIMYNNINDMLLKLSYVPINTSFNSTIWNTVHAAADMIPELQQTVTYMISQLNAASLIDLNSLHTALDEADGSLQSIADRLELMK
jgi:hypothetical protein